MVLLCGAMQVRAGTDIELAGSVSSLGTVSGDDLRVMSLSAGTGILAACPTELNETVLRASAETQQMEVQQTFLQKQEDRGEQHEQEQQQQPDQQSEPQVEQQAQMQPEQPSTETLPMAAPSEQDLQKTRALDQQEADDVPVLPLLATTGDSESTETRQSPKQECDANRAASEPLGGVDRETFSDIRIEQRSCSKASWEADIKLMSARIVSFSKLKLLSTRQKDQNDVIIGVLYEASTEKLANGALYLRLGLTDLAAPDSRQIFVQLWGRAFAQWKTGRQKAAIGAIIAIVNPVFVIGTERSDQAVKVDNAKGNQLKRLGVCPSLSICARKTCQKPVNLDLGHRLCVAHRNEEEDKEMQQSAPPPVISEARAAVAVHLDNRRLMSSGANRDYVQSVCRGTRTDRCVTSKVPVLGRAMSERSTLQLDLDTVDTEEIRKAQRMLDNRAERAERDAACQSKRQRTTEGPVSASGERSVGGATPRNRELQRIPSDMSSLNPSAACSKRKSETKGVAQKPMPPEAVAAHQETPAVAVERAKGLVSELAAAGKDVARLRGVLEAAQTLPVVAVDESGLYNAVGRLMAVNELRSLVSSSRRKWRVAFDAQRTALASRPAAVVAVAAVAPDVPEAPSVENTAVPGSAGGAQHSNQVVPIDGTPDPARDGSTSRLIEGHIVPENTKDTQATLPQAQGGLDVAGHSGLPATAAQDWCFTADSGEVPSTKRQRVAETCSTEEANREKDVLETAKSLVSEISAAGKDVSRLKVVLEVAQTLPVPAIHESGLYAAVGRLMMISDLRGLVASSRRKWRAACDAQKVAHAPRTEGVPQDLPREPPIEQTDG